MEEAKGRSLITITPDTKEFTACGKRYLIEEKISHQRWKEFQFFSQELMMGITPSQTMQAFLEIYKITNEEGCRKGDIAVIARDAMKGLESIDTRRDSALMLCTLFINTEDEDRRYISDDLMEQKINDWLEEGIDEKSFFALALSSIDGFTEAYRAIFEISSLEKKMQEKKPERKSTVTNTANSGTMKKGAGV
jgi:hypothetical protein